MLGPLETAPPGHSPDRAHVRHGRHAHPGAVSRSRPRPQGRADRTRPRSSAGCRCWRSCWPSGFALPAAAAMGLVIMGTCPGGTTSNMFAYYSRADVALSVSMTAASKLVARGDDAVLCFGCSRVLQQRRAHHPLRGSRQDAGGAAVLPVALRMWLRKRRGEGFAQRAEKVGGLAGHLRAACCWWELGCSAMPRLFSTITPADVRGGYLARAWAGWCSAIWQRGCSACPTPQRRAVSLETGIQNSPLAFAIIARRASTVHRGGDAAAPAASTPCLRVDRSLAGHAVSTVAPALPASLPQGGADGAAGALTQPGVRQSRLELGAALR